jgi:choline kinase
MKDSKGNELIINENGRGNNQICIKYAKDKWIRGFGNIKGDTFYSKRTNRQFFRKYNAWTLSVMVLIYLQKKNVKNIKITNSDDKKTYTTTLDKFISLGKKIDYKDFEEQYYLSLEYFGNNLQ